MVADVDERAARAATGAAAVAVLGIGDAVDGFGEGPLLMVDGCMFVLVCIFIFMGGGGLVTGRRGATVFTAAFAAAVTPGLLNPAVDGEGRLFCANGDGGIAEPEERGSPGIVARGMAACAGVAP